MYKKICDFEHLYKSYRLAQLDNRYKRKVCAFSFSLEENLLRLRWELTNSKYQPRPYVYFTINDPKTRRIAAPDFRDRVVQHSLVDVIEPLFDKQFVYDSYACRMGRGTHFAARRVKRFLMSARCVYGSQTKLYVLQCDIRQFFQSISWDILTVLIGKTVQCPKTFALIKNIVTNHRSNHQILSYSMPTAKLLGISTNSRTGLPIGNLTSQLFANIYLNQLDHFIKDRLRLHWYGRYMDDFLIIHPDRSYLVTLQSTIDDFLKEKLHLSLHPRKLTIKNVADGVPFVGYRIFYDHILVRGNTLRRIERKYHSKIKQYKQGKITKQKLNETKAAFIGHLKHADSYGLAKKLFEEVP